MSEDTPYFDEEAGRSSGWSGSETSKERAHRDDASGRTAKRRVQMLAILEYQGAAGLTWWEAADYFGLHHGQVSGTLSNLHKAGRVARLIERRGRSSIYVLPEYVGGRDTAPHGGKARDDEYAITAEQVGIAAGYLSTTIAPFQHVENVRGALVDALQAAGVVWEEQS